MGTFTPRGLGSIWLYLMLKTISCNRNGSNYFSFSGYSSGRKWWSRKGPNVFFFFFFFFFFFVFVVILRSLSSDSSGQLDVFWHDGYSFSVDGTEVTVFEQSHQVCFCGLL